MIWEYFEAKKERIHRAINIVCIDYIFFVLAN